MLVPGSGCFVDAFVPVISKARILHPASWMYWEFMVVLFFYSD